MYPSTPHSMQELVDSPGEKLPGRNRNKKISLIFVSQTPAWLELPFIKNSKQFFQIAMFIFLYLSSSSKKLIKPADSTSYESNNPGQHFWVAFARV